MEEFKITKEQILELAKSSWSEPPLKRWFPEAFETKFEVGNFNNGVWATIIPTMTRQEAEEKLGVKICD